MRHGPFAPSTFQFGKYDALTSTGVPTLLTWNEMVSVPVTMSVTATGVVGIVSTDAVPSSSAAMRCHSLGPPDAGYTAHCLASMYQASTAFNQSFGATPVRTAG